MAGIIERVSRFRCGGSEKTDVAQALAARQHAVWNIRECVAALWAACNCGMWIYIESPNYRVASAHRYSKGKSMCVIILSV